MISYYGTSATAQLQSCRTYNAVLFSGAELDKLPSKKGIDRLRYASPVGLRRACHCSLSDLDYRM